MNIDQTRLNILELCSETTYGSWEFWSTKDNKTEQECKHIVQTIIDLIKEKKIFPMEYKSVADLSCAEVPLDDVRLEKEVRRSMTPNNVDLESFYWFLATDAGKAEDKELRQK